MLKAMRIEIDLVKMEFNDLSTAQRTGIAVAVLAELGAKIAAFVDLSRRPAAKVRGPKSAWAVGLFLNGVGPAAYWALARK